MPPASRPPLVVTGALGVTGRALMARLARRPWPGALRVVLRPGTAAERLAVLPEGAEVREADLGDPAAVAEALGGAGTVIHLAGAGLAGSLVPAAFAAGAGHVVAVQTTSRFSRLKPEAQALAETEDWLRVRFDGLTVLRPTMIYGDPDDRNLSRLLALLSRRRVIPVPGSGRGLMQPVHVSDVARAALVAARRPKRSRGKAYDLAGQAPVSFRTLLEVAARAVGRRPVFVRVPLGLALAGMRIARRAGRPLPVTEDQLRRLEEDKAFDWSAAARDIGFDPLTVEEGLARLAVDMGLSRR